MDSEQTSRVQGHQRKQNNQLLEVLGEQSNGTPVGKKNNQKDKLKWNRPNRVYNRNSTKPPKKPKGSCSCSGGCKRECGGYSKGGRL